MAEHQERIANLLALARVADTEQQWAQFFAIAAAWNKLAIYRELAKDAFVSPVLGTSSSCQESSKGSAK